MRVFVLFDLPVKKKEDRRNYSRFHTFLLQDGYQMMQYSVYSRICLGLDGVEKHLRRLKGNLPPKGSVRCMTVTEKQYADMHFLVGKPSPSEQKINVEQLTLL